MIFSAFLSGPACSLHGLWGLPLFQLHPQPHFVHNSFDALSKRFLRHVWKVLDLPGEILAKSGLSRNFAEVRKSCVPAFRGGGDQPRSGPGVDPCDRKDWIRILKPC